MNHNQAVGGLVNRAFLSGSHDNQKYLKRFPRAVWPNEGNYRIQATPGEVAAVITHTRSYLKGKRMLCLGVGTLGAERFIAEVCGILEMDIVDSERLAGYQTNRDGMQGIKVNEVKAPSGQYDLITIAGDSQVDTKWVTGYSKISTVIACLGIGPAAGQKNLRTAWFVFRRDYMVYQTLLQTGGLNYETGVGVVRVLTLTKEAKENLDANDQNRHDGAPGEPEQAPIPENPETVEAGVTAAPLLDDVQDISGSEPEDGEGVDPTEPVEVSQGPNTAIPKRRGRQPGSKNKPKVEA